MVQVAKRIDLRGWNLIFSRLDSRAGQMIKVNKHPFFKDAKDLQSLVSMLAPQYSQSQIREFYLNGLLPDFIGTDMDYWMLIRRYYALKEQYRGDT